MNILVTGIDGFIGQHVGRFLIGKHNVFGVTRSTVPSNTLPGVQLILADLSAPTFVDKLPVDTDCVIHLAQSKQYRDFPVGADDMRLINIDATCRLLEWARRIGVKHFIFSSTANVYGKSGTSLTESDATQPESFYGATKLAAEHLVKQYQEFYKVDILRLFTVYGPGQKGMLIPNIADRIIRGQPVTLANNVGLYLTPIYVDDVVLAINALIENTNAVSCRLLNVCGDEVTDLGAVVRILEKVLSEKACVHSSNEPVQHFSGKNDVLRNYLSMQKMTDLETGIARTFKPTS